MRDELLDLARGLVAIDSVNPDLVPGGAGEAEVARFAADWMEAAGLETRLEEVAAGRFNAIGIARGSGGGKTLLLNGHIDTVGTAGMDSPHEPRLEGSKLHGRGAYDMKTAVAAAMVATARARELGLRGDVVVTAVCDEEVASIGSAHVAEAIHADAAIVVEPTELQVAIAHRGFVWLDVEATGRAAHGSRPDLGVDAIAKMGRILVGLEELDRSLRPDPAADIYASGSLHASLVEGGQELSSYPERCLLRMERRTIPGETAASVEEEVRDVIARAAAEDPDVRAEAKATFERPPFEVPRDAPVVEAVHRHGTTVLGREAEIARVPFWTDAAIFSDAGIPTVLFGPAGEGAHAVVEWVDVDSAVQCAEVYLAVAAELCA